MNKDYLSALGIPPGYLETKQGGIIKPRPIKEMVYKPFPCCVKGIVVKKSDYLSEQYSNFTLRKVWEFKDNQYHEYKDSSGNVTHNRIGFIGDKPHNLKVGDIVIIKQKSPYTHAEYEGEATVIEAPTDKEIIINKSFMGVTGAEGGEARYGMNLLKVGGIAVLSIAAIWFLFFRKPKKS